MATITASVDAVRSIVWIEVDYASDPSVTSVRVVRVLTLTGEEERVRVHSWPGDGLDCIMLVGSSATLYDTEAPLDIPFSYRLEDCDGVAASVLSSEHVVPSSGRFWLKDPVRPYANVPVTQRGDQNPCLPVSGVYFRSMGEESFPGAGVLQRAVNRRNGIAVVRPRYGYSSTLNLATRQFIDRDAVRDLLSTGDVLQIQGPASYGIPEVYVHVPGTPVWQRLSSDHKRQWRIVSIPFDEVDRPAGLGYGVLGTRWMDLCDVYGSFAAMEAAGISWRDVMAGQAGAPSDTIVSGWRTYAMVNAEFASYTAVLGAGFTVVSDNFNRVTANSWGTASGAGGAWGFDGGVAANYSTTGTLGQHAHTTVNVARVTFIGSFAGDIDMVATRLFYGTLPATSPIQVGFVARWLDANNFYGIRMFLMPDNSVLLNLHQVIAGVETNSGLVAVSGVNATTTVLAMRVQIRGTLVQVRVWDSAGTEPILTWHNSMTMTGLSIGAVGFRSVLQAGNTNVLPVNITYDNFTVTATDRTYQELLEGD